MQRMATSAVHTRHRFPNSEHDSFEMHFSRTRNRGKGKVALLDASSPRIASQLIAPIPSRVGWRALLSAPLLATVSAMFGSAGGSNGAGGVGITGIGSSMGVGAPSSSSSSSSGGGVLPIVVVAPSDDPARHGLVMPEERTLPIAQLAEVMALKEAGACDVEIVYLRSPGQGRD